MAWFIMPFKKGKREQGIWGKGVWNRPNWLELWLPNLLPYPFTPLPLTPSSIHFGSRTYVTTDFDGRITDPLNAPVDDFRRSSPGRSEVI